MYLELVFIAKQLKPKTSLDHDNISTKLLKESIEHIAVLLKLAKVIPVFKSGENKKFNNYRPISILPAFSKGCSLTFPKRSTPLTLKHYYQSFTSTVFERFQMTRFEATYQIDRNTQKLTKLNLISSKLFVEFLRGPYWDLFYS